LSAVKRFRWLILGFLLLGLGGGLVATRFIQPEYRVNATIFVESPNAGRQGEPIQGGELLAGQSWVQLLRSFKVLDPVVRQRGLYLLGVGGADSALFRGFTLGNRFLPGEYEFVVGGEGKSYTLTHRGRLISEAGAIGDSVGRLVGFQWLPRPARALFGEKIRFEVLTPREASVKLSEQLITALRERNFLTLQLEGPDPDATATTLNAVLSQFIAEAATQKREKLSLLAEVLDTQVVEQAERLKLAEESLEAFRVSTVTLPRDETPVAAGLQFTQPTVYGTYFQMRSERDGLRRNRESIEELIPKAARGEVTVDAFNTIAAVRAAPDLLRVLGEYSTAQAELRAALVKYTEEHPGVKDLRDRIEVIRSQTVPLYASALVQQLKDQEHDLDIRIQQGSTELRTIPSRAQTESRLEREVDQADQLYRALERSRQQARLAEASAIPDVRILDSAEAPTRPSKNSAPTLILLGLLLGLTLGVGLTLLIDRLDKRFRYPDQVSKGLGLPILGTIPQIHKSRGVAASPDEAAQVIEAFRSVRLNLAHSFEPGQAMTLAISSPSPADGKSFISSNLALSFAEAGYRTVLVDGDIRRGDLHRTFGAERSPGLLDYLANGTEVGATLRPTSHPKLMVIPTGLRRRDGPELLGTGRMKEIIETLRGQFDVILVDTPPLGAGIDPFVIATITQNLALVLRAGETDRQLAEAKLQVLDRLPIQLLGAILNDVRVGEGAYKYDAYSYHYVTDHEEAVTSLPESRKGEA
jgi:capsular exopolysaccharide synthesis family protein